MYTVYSVQYQKIMDKRYILGIDTSNYKTSVAVTDENQSIICDIRRFLEVKQGEKGLRQSDALFQHVKNLPDMIEAVRERFDGEISAVAYSSKPRPIEGSYMPVFLAGESFARTLGAALKVPVYAFSHQEGHIEAVKAYSALKDDDEFLACHFSGGTSELLKVTGNETGYDIDIIGGSKDIAFGQVIDRAGVMMGMKFPSGEEMDRIASAESSPSALLTSIKVNQGYLNLSGIDTQIKRLLQDPPENFNESMLIREIFEKTADAMYKMIVQSAEAAHCTKVLMAGGVCSSSLIKQILKEKFNKAGITAVFDDTGLSQDNAVGTSLLGGKSYGIETCKSFTT